MSYDQTEPAAADQAGTGEVRFCAACGAADLRAHLRVRGLGNELDLKPTTDRFGAAFSNIVKCAACGHMQLERFPTQATLSEAYAQASSDDYVLEEAGQRLTARRTL